MNVRKIVFITLLISPVEVKVGQNWREISGEGHRENIVINIVVGCFMWKFNLKKP